MKTHIEGTRVYVSAEPCHFGMIELHRYSDAAVQLRCEECRRQLPHLKRFQPVAFPGSVDIVA